MPGVPSLITSLETFSGVSFFGMDEMHLLSHGVGRLVFEILNPAFNGIFKPDNASNYTFELARVSNFRVFGQYIKESRETVPPSFEGAWNENFGAYRAVDWQDFLLVAVPLIVGPRIQKRSAFNAIMNLVNGCSRALSKELTEEDVEKLDR